MALLLSAPALAAPQPADCPPIKWNSEHPDDCRNALSGAAVPGPCCDAIRKRFDGPMPKPCKGRSFSYVTVVDACIPNDHRAIDHVCCEPRK